MESNEINSEPGEIGVVLQLKQHEFHRLKNLLGSLTVSSISHSLYNDNPDMERGEVIEVTTVAYDLYCQLKKIEEERNGPTN